MYRTIPVKARFTDEEKAFWLDQCQHANNLINCAIYHTRQTHYARLQEMDNAYTSYWRGDELCSGWKTYQCNGSYPELDKALKDNPHYKGLAAQAAQQTLKSVGESITSYNGLVKAYYKGEVDRPSLPKYRKKGGLAAVTFPRQALSFKDGYFKPSISKETKPELIIEVKLKLPDFINSDWVKEVTVRPCLGEFVIDWVIEDGKEPIKVNPNLDYSHALSLDHGGTNWLTGVSTRGKSFIVDGRKLKAMNQGYCRLVAKYKQGKSDFYWAGVLHEENEPALLERVPDYEDRSTKQRLVHFLGDNASDSNLDRVQRKRNNQMRDAINKAARFIVSRCLNDKIGNIIIGWNDGHKVGSEMGKINNQNFVPIPTGRLIARLKQLACEYGIVVTVTEEAYTSKASFLDGDSLHKFGEKPTCWKPSGRRVERGLYKTTSGLLINADANGAANIMRKVATQLGVSLAEVGRAVLTTPQRYDLFKRLDKSYRRRSEVGLIDPVAATV